MAKLTQKAILQTFEDMLREMPFDKITVSALVCRCCVSPNTFYYHYQDIYDLLDAWLKVRLSGYASQAHTPDEWPIVLKAMLHDIQNNPEIASHILDSISRERMEHCAFDILEGYLLEMVQKRTAPMSSQTQKALASVFCYTLIGGVLQFVHSGMQGDIDSEFDPLIRFLVESSLNAVRKESIR